MIERGTIKTLCAVAYQSPIRHIVSKRQRLNLFLQRQQKSKYLNLSCVTLSGISQWLNEIRLIKTLSNRKISATTLNDTPLVCVIRHSSMNLINHDMLIYVKKTYLSRVKTFFRTIIIRYKHLLSYLLPPLQIFVLQDCNVDDFWFYNKFNRSLFLFKYLSNTISTPCSMNSAKPMCTEYGINILLRLYFLHLYLINVYDNDWQQF